MVRELADRIHMLDCRRTVAAGYQPQKQGRCFVYRVIQGKEPESLTPDDENHLNVRARMHEYGGRFICCGRRDRLLLQLRQSAALSAECWATIRYHAARTGTLPALIRDSRRQADY